MLKVIFAASIQSNAMPCRINSRSWCLGKNEENMSAGKHHGFTHLGSIEMESTDGKPVATEGQLS
jgi:hypothetical protein